MAVAASTDASAQAPRVSLGDTTLSANIAEDRGHLGAVHLRKGRQELAVLAQAFQLTLRDGSRLMASDFATEQALLRSEIATKDPRATGSQLCTRLFHKPTGLRATWCLVQADGRALPARDP